MTAGEYRCPACGRARSRLLNVTGREDDAKYMEQLRAEGVHPYWLKPGDQEWEIVDRPELPPGLSGDYDCSFAMYGEVEESAA